MFFFSSRRRHTRYWRDWSSDVCSSDLLKKSYNGFEAVKGVDFEVFPGECFGFLGPNGAGKTSTMKMIYAAAEPTGGELSVVGLDVTRHDREVKRRIGVVPQENNLDEGLKVRENLLVYGRYFD